MKEQSHKDEMSAALRGDFERLRKRGVFAELAPRDAPAVPDTDPCHDDLPGTGSQEPAAVADSPDGEAAAPARGAVSSTDDEPSSPPATDPVSDIVSGPSAGWLGRLLGRS